MQARTCLILSVIAVFLGSCAGEVRELCGPQLDTMRHELKDAESSLGPGRGLASEQRRDWQSWARIRLDRAQKYLDLMAMQPRYEDSRRELSRVADDLVAFSGYASFGKRKEMLRSLASIESRLDRIGAEQGCATP